MRQAIRFLAFAIAVLAAAWFAMHGEGGSEMTAGGTTRTSDSVGSRAPAPAVEVVAATPSGARAELESAPVDTTVAVAQVSPEFRDDRLVVRIEDVSGRPFAGASVMVFEQDGWWSRSALAFRAEEARSTGTSDATGICRFTLERWRTFTVLATAPGFARVIRGGVLAGSEQVIRLGIGGSVNGRVVRSRDGTAVPGATVTLQPHDRSDDASRQLSSQVTTTNAAGEFQFERAAAGEYQVDAKAPELAPFPGRYIDVVDGGVARVDIEISEGVIVRGVVIDAKRRAPLADARVGARFDFDDSVRTGSDGTFEFHGLTGLDLLARKDGFADTAQRIRDAQDAPPPEFVTIEMKMGRRITGRVETAEQQPIAGATVIAVSMAYRDPTQRLEWLETQTDEHGQYSIVGLDPDLRHILLVRRPGYGGVNYEFPFSEPTEPVIAIPPITLKRGGSISGRVLDDEGKGIPNIPVERIGENDDRRRFGTVDAGLVDRLQLTISQVETRTDQLGRFSFCDLAAGTYVLHHRFPASHASIQTQVYLGDEEHRDDIKLYLSAGRTIAGRVETRDGGKLPTVYISVDSENGGKSTDIHVAADGSFCARGLSEGMYTLSFYPYDLVPSRTRASVYQQQTLEHVPVGTAGLVVRLERQDK